MNFFVKNVIFLYFLNSTKKPGFFSYLKKISSLTLRWHTGIKKIPGMFKLNLSPFNIWIGYLYGPVTLEKVMIFFVKNVIFRYFLNSTIFFPYLK